MLRAELNQSRLKGGQRLPRAVLAKVHRAIAKQKKQKGEYSIAFLSDAEMRKLNKAYRGKDCVTDVLAFPSKEPGYLGEVLISYAQAKRQAKQMGHSTRDEIVFLLVHGILHLFGHDHIKPADAKKMFPLQTKILTSLGIDPRL